MGTGRFGNLDRRFDPWLARGRWFGLDHHPQLRPPGPNAARQQLATPIQIVGGRAGGGRGLAGALQAPQRAAGTFCAHNRYPLILPCHRVVAANGLGAYGSLGADYKRRLLELEGVSL